MCVCACACERVCVCACARDSEWGRVVGGRRWSWERWRCPYLLSGARGWAGWRRTPRCRSRTRWCGLSRRRRSRCFRWSIAGPGSGPGDHSSPWPPGRRYSGSLEHKHTHTHTHISKIGTASDDGLNKNGWFTVAKKTQTIDDNSKLTLISQRMSTRFPLNVSQANPLVIIMITTYSFMNVCVHMLHKGYPTMHYE